MRLLSHLQTPVTVTDVGVACCVSVEPALTGCASAVGCFTYSKTDRLSSELADNAR